MDVATVVVVKHQDDVHPGTSQATPREHFPGRSLNQDVGSQTWPGCMIWGKSLAFPEPLLICTMGMIIGTSTPATLKEVGKNQNVKTSSDA